MSRGSICSCVLELIFPRFWNVYLIDATTVETIDTDLSAIVFTKGIGEEDTLGLLDSGRSGFSCSITRMIPQVFPKLLTRQHLNHYPKP